jgi:hypothetical protein
MVPDLEGQRIRKAKARTQPLTRVDTTKARCFSPICSIGFRRFCWLIGARVELTGFVHYGNVPNREVHHARKFDPRLHHVAMPVHAISV